ncbi:MAG TPA: hypothetical protein P5571_15650 [Candidatus Krumholzibacteria bacterium]|nr:hypothetical protein [Candidatus Krumholzibacteria bacterium]HRX52803.1 hypothetical protein [Candidatus Krumholzibacteria bacterium]
MSGRFLAMIERIRRPWLTPSPTTPGHSSITYEPETPPGVEECTDFVLQREEWSIPGLPGKVIDIDFGPDGDWVALCSNADVGACVTTPRSTLALPGRGCPSYIRIVAHGGIAVLYQAPLDPSMNVELGTAEGRTVHVFCVGRSACGAVACNERILAFYMDQGVLSGPRPDCEALCAFTLGGEVDFGYFSGLEDPPVDIFDCYCACFVAPDVVGFMGPIFEQNETDFPYVLLNLSTRRQTVHPTPIALDNPRALTWDGQAVIVYGPDHDRNGFYRWIPGAETVQKIGEYDGRLRDGGHGRFLEVRPDGCAILTFQPRELTPPSPPHSPPPATSR